MRNSIFNSASIRVHLRFLFLLVCLACARPGSAPAQPATRVIGPTQLQTSRIATNAWVGFTNAHVNYLIVAENSSASDLWLHIYDTNAVPANGASPIYPGVLIPAGKTGGYDFPYGAPFRRGVTVCNSTTDRTLTNSSANFVITVLYDDRKP